MKEKKKTQMLRPFYKALWVLFLLSPLLSTAQNDKADTALLNDDYWLSTLNFNMRKPVLVVLHHTAQNSIEETIKTFNIDHRPVSAHYLIGKDGTVHHLLNDYLRAWQAGNSSWRGFSDVNSFSIGIELDNNGADSFPPLQIQGLLQLLSLLKDKYHLDTAAFVGHSDVAPGRKDDPGITFPWHQLADSGFGYWYDDTTGVTVPQDFDVDAALRIIGYSLTNRKNTIMAFRHHFEGRDYDGSPLTLSDKKILFTLYKKYL